MIYEEATVGENGRKASLAHRSSKWEREAVMGSKWQQEAAIQLFFSNKVNKVPAIRRV